MGSLSQPGARPPLTFSVNGTAHHPSEDPATPLSAYLRDTAGITSVKVGCGEGGCGACAVLVSGAATPTVQRTVNACLTPIASLDGAAITTAAGLGDGVIDALASHHASQCGYCTPGMAVACAAAAAAAAAAGPDAQTDTIARSLDGNLCRCTGYRPILDAARSLGPADVEDLGSACAARAAGLAAHAAVTAAAPSCLLPASDRPWAAPRSLAEFWATMSAFGSASGPATTTVVAGNTGSGVYKGTWPPPPGTPVVSLSCVAELVSGAAFLPSTGIVASGGATLAQLAAACDAAAAAGGGENPATRPAWAGPGRWAALAAHLRRVAGAHVRAAATIGGNVALAAHRALESDPVTILAAARARATVATEGGAVRLSLDELLGLGSAPAHALASRLGSSALIEGLTVPPPPQGGETEVFFSTRTAARYSHAVADFNAALSVTVDGAWKLGRDPVIVFGAPSAGPGTPWRAVRAAAVEQALGGATAGDPAALAAAIRAARDAVPGGDEDPYVDGLAEAAIVAALGGLWAAGAAAAGTTPPPKAAAVFAASAPPPPAPVTGTRSHGAPLPGCAPVGRPGTTKDRVRAQAAGTAVYTGDLPLPAGGLHAAPVLSTRARAGLAGLDTAAALALPGVVRVVTAADIPPGGSNDAPHGDILFASDAVTYVGQRVALVLGTSHAAAAAGAAAVTVRYTDAPPPGTLGAPDGSPILSIADALAADSFYELEPVIGPTTKAHGGDVDAALDASPIVVRGVKVSMPSQAHLYMENQTAMAVPGGEGGGVTVYSATQCIDMVQHAVCQALGAPAHAVCAKLVSRVGGGFGGKSARSEPVAACAAVAAVAAGAPVKWALTRSDDLASIGGRCEMEATFSVGCTPEGKVTAVDIDAVFLGGAQPEISTFIPLLAANTMDQNFDLPASRTRVRLAKCNLPPRTIMRAPGTLQAVLCVEAVLEAVSAATGVHPILVRERNLLTHPLLAGPRKPCAGVLAAGTHDPAADAAAGHGGDPHPSAAELADAEVMAGETGRAGGGPAAYNADGTLPAGPAFNADGTTDVAVKSAFGKELPLDQYSIPKLWDALKDKADLGARMDAVAAANADPAAPPWTKRGLAATACRFVMSVDPKPAMVSIHFDGSVLVNGPAHEMGQGAATKSLLAAAAALSHALTPAGRAAVCGDADGHLPLSLFRVADVSTDTLPNTGPSWGSTTSEAACEAVRQAAAQLAAGLRPKYEELEAAAAKGGAPAPTWADLIKAVHPSPGFSASSQPLTAYAFYDGTQRHDGGAGKDALSYNGYGVAATEVEVDALTGAVTVLRADIILDAGHSLWPDGDLGQVEGGYIQGLGLFTSEAVRVDGSTGGLLSKDLWSYKVPTVDTLPRRFNVALLEGGSHARGVYSSKAVGEPPLLLAVTALTATQAAINAVRDALGEAAEPPPTNGEVVVRGQAPRPAPASLLTAPATPRAVREAVGRLPLAEWVGGGA